ncbi:chymotrypsin-1-like [Megachile rotundata]|uniref:chymotrypsin-1-like n=1 Tax=Megachile rotundata TaxID=143995 RepID=UPI000258DD68|nr:PREDICTED: chymotrypsin-1-like [Megachile rotundata]
MQALSVPILLYVFAIAYGFPEPQIVGGTDAPIGMFPYQVSLRQYDRHFCGGSIISSRYVLTAAHCVEGIYDKSSVTIHAGTNVLSSKGESYGVQKIVSHSGYDSSLLINDVAIIRVNKEIEFNDLVRPIPLAAGNNTFEGSECTLSGWGRIKAGGPIPDKLQYITLLIESEAKCKRAHDNVESSHICTFTKFGEGACNGDSGSPLVINDLQVGIVSFGMPCGVGYPDVYSRVSSFTTWIKEQYTLLQKDEIAAQPEDIIFVP